MTALTCPACGLQQTLDAPRCARCGAALDGSGLDALRQAMTTDEPERDESPTALFDPGEVDDRTMVRSALPQPSPGEPAEASGARSRVFQPSWTTPAPPPVPSGDGLKGWWRRLTGKQA